VRNKKQRLRVGGGRNKGSKHIRNHLVGKRLLLRRLKTQLSRGKRRRRKGEKFLNKE